MKNNPKLVNFTTQDFMSEKELELTSLRWDKVKDSYYKRLKELGLLRFVSLRIWNKENIARLGFVFEYKDEKAFKACLPVWKEIDAIDAMESEDMVIKTVSNRGIVLENTILG